MSVVLGGALTLTMMAVGFFSPFIVLAIDHWAERRQRGGANVA